MVKEIPVYQSNKILTAAQLNQMWRSMSALELLGFVEATGLPKAEFNIGNLSAITNGSLVGDVLSREGNGLKVYDSSGSLVDEIDWEYLISGAVETKGLTRYNKYWKWGFIPQSGSTSDEQVTITAGKALCQDGSTVVELTSTKTDLDYPTLLGSALASSTTYHLFRYKKDNDTMQWHLSTSLTPTISDIKSALAYRRVLSLKTDIDGDLLAFVGFALQGGAIRIEYSAEGVIEGTSIGSATKATLTCSSIPAGIEVDGIFSIQKTTASLSCYYMIFHPSLDPTVDLDRNDMDMNIAGGADYDISIKTILRRTNTSSQISHKGRVTGTAGNSITCYGYVDYFNNF